MTQFIQDLKANDTGKNQRYPDGLYATDSNARLVLVNGEKVQNMLKYPSGIRGILVPNDRQPMVYPNPTDMMQWEITFTDKRILYWSPMSSGLFSGLKMKPGRSTGGFIEYNDIQYIMLAPSLQADHVRVVLGATFGGMPYMIDADLTHANATDYLDTILRQLKSARLTLPSNATEAACTTIDNYRQKVIGDLPQVTELSLAWTGPIVTVLDGDDHLIEELTAVQAYSDAGVYLT